ncbi:RHO protein signal transduction [Scheffersomyces stipitis CBS 6054]|uniref:RHO protein signal transduction n=1 Tax=Scheffersomyces stipitis (strain ATCC 58785 / CBS 6054 / NBRC 10063 / NRRL Y-11545) TaxID=322104 RepID=A3M0F7_PICST|nr:RHO protein signal transduction [Scheffersomyces stipitis CBS 6054]ABN68516.2 RHO protein signal transduction [Scheffersomyces stipitis CBS 6054]KAG2731070.1 hypothetical protein G9P44_006219 [Scheffersomyces stipitis]
MTTTGAVYISIKQFNARLGDELSLKVGDKIEVLADDSEYNDGWYMGKNLLTNEVGLYPKTFTQILQKQNPDKSLLRSRSRRVGTPVNGSSKEGASTPPLNGGSASSTPATKISNVSDSVEKLNLNGTASTNKDTISEIDKALKELQPTSDSNEVSAASKSVPNAVSRTQKRVSSAPLTEDLDPLQASSWTPQQVSSYFAFVLGFDMDVAGKFSRHKITGPILFELDLGHLKELDIDSFGTRFEVYKEIEKLKELSSKSISDKSRQHSLASTNADPNGSTFSETSPGSENFQSTETSPKKTDFSNNSDEDRTLTNNSTRSQSKTYQQLMPSAPLSSTFRDSGFNKGHHRKRSMSMDNLAHDSSSFTSPRKAPEPPSGTASSGNHKFVDDGDSNSGLYLTRTNASNPGLSSRPSSSVYEQSVKSHKKNGSQASSIIHRRNSSVNLAANAHKRHSSLFSFLSGHDDSKANSKTPKLQSTNLYKETVSSPSDGQKDGLTSPAKLKRDSLVSTPSKPKDVSSAESPIDIDEAQLSPRKSKSISYKKSESPSIKDDQRSVSDASAVGKLKNLRTSSTQNFRSFTTSRKAKTSAFQEGIRDVTPDDAIKSANYSGWMSKRSSNTLAWRSRYFTLHGTRLSYFASLRDKKEKGLIDITAHKVIPISTDSDETEDRTDKYTALYASSTFNGSYCFKLVPPRPGFRKGLTFTQPKTHYFAVDSQEEMRGWIKALMTATIDIDDTEPVVSSCSTPTVSLTKAKELLAKAREETKLKDEELRAQGFLRDGVDDDYDLHVSSVNDFATSVDTSSVDDTTGSSGNAPKLSIDTNVNSSQKQVGKTPSTPQISSSSAQSGFASPYLLASGLLSPKSNSTASPTNSSPSNIKIDPNYFQDVHPSIADASEATPKTYSNGRIVSSRKNSRADKMLAYTSDPSGNHSFVIKQKK